METWTVNDLVRRKIKKNKIFAAFGNVGRRSRHFSPHRKALDKRRRRFGRSVDVASCLRRWSPFVWRQRQQQQQQQQQQQNLFTGN